MKRKMMSTLVEMAINQQKTASVGPVQQFDNKKISRCHSKNKIS